MKRMIQIWKVQINHTLMIDGRAEGFASTTLMIALYGPRNAERVIRKTNRFLAERKQREQYRSPTIVSVVFDGWVDA